MILQADDIRAAASTVDSSTQRGDFCFQHNAWYVVPYRRASPLINKGANAEHAMHCLAHVAQLTAQLENAPQPRNAYAISIEAGNCRHSAAMSNCSRHYALTTDPETNSMHCCQIHWPAKQQQSVV